MLFLDELAEFPRPVCEALRQPVEDGEVTVVRSAASVRFPARFSLVTVYVLVNSVLGVEAATRRAQHPRGRRRLVLKP